ncbi:hypothetical protein WR25_00542 [Diploscapter pachys]|uniref:Uncharacterized protein n=1 Tax=Diploscapter pachys TaxID=2018661 RepID=A0A2A2M3N0_9BILA|nr:hypothetical protein WR25_00542 [Diploscapter pachys]
MQRMQPADEAQHQRIRHRLARPVEHRPPRLRRSIQRHGQRLDEPRRHRRIHRLAIARLHLERLEILCLTRHRLASCRRRVAPAPHPQ